MIDLIDECGEDLTACGYETIQLKKYSATSSKLFIDSSVKAKTLGFDKGHYFIINAPLLYELMDEHQKMLEEEFLTRMNFLLKESKFKKRGKILCVGIGNPKIVADSFGCRVIDKLEIQSYKKNNKVLKIQPNTFANTGINAYDIVRLIVEAFDVSLVILFDSLATTNIARLGTSIQFNDAGLTPGSALNNFGMPINKTTLNVPCISIGVPMMISSKDLGQKKEIILTEKDAEEKVEFFARLVANVLKITLNS